MVVAHELFHKPGWCNQVFGTIEQCKNLYMHFIYQHLYGHHRNVATPLDPATSPKGLTVYQFVPKSIAGTWKHVYEMEKNEVKKPFYLNYAVLSLVSNVFVVSFIWYLFNTQATIFFVSNCVLAIFFLEAINYLEHYGLRRKKLPNGEYEKVTIQHSWNAPHRFTNYFIFKLQRHSDHH